MPQVSGSVPVYLSPLAFSTERRSKKGARRGGEETGVGTGHQWSDGMPRNGTGWDGMAAAVGTAGVINTKEADRGATRSFQNCW